MSKSQRDKGNRFEREVVNYLKEKGFNDAKEYLYQEVIKDLREI